MKIHAQAVKGHLIVGIALILPILVWGGAETRRYLEAWMSKQHA